MSKIAEKFGFQYPYIMSKEVEAADKSMLVLEWDELMIKRRREIKGHHIFSATYAKTMFLAKFNELMVYNPNKNDR